MYVKRDFYEQLSIRKPDCFNKCDSIEEVVNDVTSILNESKGIVLMKKTNMLLHGYLTKIYGFSMKKSKVKVK